MNIKKMMAVGIAGVAIGAMALDNVEVTDVQARQRYPWNGKVDIDFTLDSNPTEPYQMSVEVFDNVGKTNLTVKSVYTPDVSFENNPCMVRTDTRRIVWDAAKDLPNGFKCTNVLVTCKDERLIVDNKRYMIVDLTTDPFGISYTNCPPSGGWTDEYKSGKLVLRKIPAGSFYMGSLLLDPEHKTNEEYHKVTLTNPFYLSVFELTESQYALVMGSSSSSLKPVEKTWSDIRGFDVVLTATVSGTTWTQTKKTLYSWPTSSNVDSSSFMGKIRSKSGMLFDLPTESQWEYACRGGATTPLYLGLTNSEINASFVCGDAVINSEGTGYSYIGNYTPNSFGLHDMTGSVDEWCLDVYKEKLGSSSLIDPKGIDEVYETIKVIDNKFIDMYVAAEYKGTVVCGGASATVPCYWYLTYNANAIRRCVRGCSVRAAERTSALSVSYKDPTLVATQTYPTSGAGNKRNFNLSYANPKHGIRLSLAINE